MYWLERAGLQNSLGIAFYMFFVRRQGLGMGGFII